MILRLPTRRAGWRSTPTSAGNTPTKDGQAVLRSNVDPATLRSIGKDIIEIADEITRQP